MSKTSDFSSQAKAGEPLYAEHCAKCHGADRAGVERAPALAGAAFGQRWRGATLEKLFARIESMQPTSPQEPDLDSVPQHSGFSAERQRISSRAFATRTRAPGTGRRERSTERSQPVEWTTYGGDLASTRYSSLDQITRDNFSKLQIAWRLTTDAFGPRPDSLDARSSACSPPGRS